MALEISLTAQELEALVLAYFHDIEAKTKRETGLFLASIGETSVEEEDLPPNVYLRDATNRLEARRVAAFILTGVRPVEPYTKDPGFAALLPTFLKEVEKIEGRPLSEEDCEAIAKTRTESHTGLLSLCDAAYPFAEGRYEMYRRWVSTVCEVATQRGIRPLDVVVTRELQDETVRRLWSKEVYLRNGEAMLMRLYGDDVFVENVLAQVRPLFDFEDLDEEARHQAEAEVLEEVGKPLRERGAKARAFYLDHLRKEADRIYGA